MLVNLEILFNFCMVMGVTIAISSNNWLMIWLGLELSMMCFLPIMSNKYKLNSESCIKYFIIQSLSSSFMMMGVIMMSIWNTEMILLLSIMIKLGISPFHTWVISIIEGMGFYSICIMLTLMKVAPINMISYLNENLNLFVIMGLLTGSMSGLNQNSIKKIMGYSSIFNISLVLASINSSEIWIEFFTLYSSSLIMLMYMISKLNLNFINQVILNSFNKSTKICCWMVFLSMGGFPPLLGFFGKMMLIKFLITNNEYLISVITILTSLIVMFFYTRIAILSMMFYFSIPKWLIQIKFNFNSAFIMTMMTVPLVLFNLKSL
uniref:NADH dehydrogenase subunit 2 n=1 Tax=Tricentrus davidi TaxID=3021815 RepID=UPI00237BADA6|nr:NADH dehydrogenase subunit 2 [Tricentrus davidi]WBV77341.1 NADH dehydrogenase subunit 2 [Tricentrus davidi]